MQTDLSLTNQTSQLATPAGGTLCAFRDLEQMFRVADYLAKSPIVPNAFQNQPGSVMIALNMAQRLRMDPFMVMQNIVVIHGNAAMSGKFAAALLNRSSKYARIEYKKLNGKDYSEGAQAIGHRHDGTIDEGTAITPDLVKKEGWASKNGSKWQTMPEQMYLYRAAAFFARVFAPEELLGMQTIEEVEDTYRAEKQAVRDVTPKKPTFLPAEKEEKPAVTEAPVVAEKPAEKDSETLELPMFGNTL